MMKHKFLPKLTAVMLVIALLVPAFTVNASAKGLLDDLFGISFYYFHYLDENGNQKDEDFYNWGAADEEKNGIAIEKTGPERLTVHISSGNEMYRRCKPVLMWLHKADSLFDVTKLTDINQWYKNKLEETFLICEIPDYTKDSTIEVRVPLKLNIGAVGLINGGYYEIEFYGEGAIPEQLTYAYKAQTYSLDELEKYIQTDMAESVDQYYNVDSGFRSDVDGVPFQNTNFELVGGKCAGIASITTAKYNGYELKTEYKVDDTMFKADSKYSWYDYVYGDKSIHDIVLHDTNMLDKNSPSKNMIDSQTATAFPLQIFQTYDESDLAFYKLLEYYLLENNKAVFLKGNSSVEGFKLNNLENRWSIIDFVASYLRQGKALTVNICNNNGGHAIVGYKMEKINENTCRLYCYDNNYPDDMVKAYKKGAPANEDLNEDGSYKNIVSTKKEIYIDFTKKTMTGYTSGFSVKEYDVFEFDSTHTSVATSSADGGVIAFSLCQGDRVGVFNYGNESNEIIAYKAFPVIQSDNKVLLRTFAFYKSGEVIEVTNSCDTTVKMDLNYIGWYKIKDSAITLTKKDKKFVETGSDYIECFVVHNNTKGAYGEIKVRIPVA